MKPASFVAMALAALLLAGCAPAPGTPVVPGGGTTPPGGSTSSVTPTATPGATTPTPTTVPVLVRVYFDHSEKMQPVGRTLPAGTKAVLKDALTALLKGPTASEKAAGLHTLIPAGTTLRGVTIAGGLATIDLSSKFASGGGTLSMTNRLAQVVFTATQFPAVDGVAFKLDGKAITVFGGEGIILEGPQTRRQFEGASPAILVETPVWGGTIRQSTLARGTANVFEAVFRLQLRDAKGTLILDRRVQATSGTGTRGTWSEDLTWTVGQPGPGTLKVFAASAKDGKPTDVVTIPVVIVD